MSRVSVVDTSLKIEISKPRETLGKVSQSPNGALSSTLKYLSCYHGQCAALWIVIFSLCNTIFAAPLSSRNFHIFQIWNEEQRERWKNKKNRSLFSWKMKEASPSFFSMILNNNVEMECLKVYVTGKVTIHETNSQVWFKFVSNFYEIPYKLNRTTVTLEMQLRGKDGRRTLKMKS